MYKGTWRGAPVAVKYAVCNTSDADSIEQSIREVVLSKKMSHPNVVSVAPWQAAPGRDMQQAASGTEVACTTAL